ncbi:unnamed protein product [Citrullus colocynthis]|uniref:Uncharacterized protein n=1 Tax=Citrullus colocynthis TaxID=252529 RepID=A0ABP0Y2E2_9ROSI
MAGGKREHDKESSGTGKMQLRIKMAGGKREHDKESSGTGKCSAESTIGNRKKNWNILVNNRAFPVQQQLARCISIIDKDSNKGKTLRSALLKQITTGMMSN